MVLSPAVATKAHTTVHYAVTGSNQGLGRALLEAVLSAGERAVATARKPETLSELSEQYPPSQLLVVPLDVTNEEQIKAAFRATKEHFRRLDVVVNNAGYGIQGEIEGTPEVEARRIMETLFWGAVHVTKEVSRRFIARRVSTQLTRLLGRRSRCCVT